MNTKNQDMVSKWRGIVSGAELVSAEAILNDFESVAKSLDAATYALEKIAYVNRYTFCDADCCIDWCTETARDAASQLATRGVRNHHADSNDWHAAAAAELGEGD